MFRHLDEAEDHTSKVFLLPDKLHIRTNPKLSANDDIKCALAPPGEYYSQNIALRLLWLTLTQDERMKYLSFAMGTKK